MEVAICTNYKSTCETYFWTFNDAPQLGSCWWILHILWLCEQLALGS